MRAPSPRSVAALAGLGGTQAALAGLGGPSGSFVPNRFGRAASLEAPSSDPFGVWDELLSANDEVDVGRTWDLAGVGTLRLTSLRNVRGFLLQGKSLAERLSASSLIESERWSSERGREAEAIRSEGGGPPGEAAEPKRLGAKTFREVFEMRLPFGRDHPLRFGEGTGVRTDVLAGQAGTAVVAGGVLLCVLAVAVALKLSILLGAILGLAGALAIALYFIVARGIALESVAVEGDCKLSATVTLTPQMEGMRSEAKASVVGSLVISEPRLLEPLPRILVSGKVGGVAVRDVEVSVPTDTLNGLIGTLSLPALTIPLG